MAIRIIELHRILKETGSFYLHCDPTMSHYLKLLLDIIFGEKNFRNEIAWCYKGASEMKIAFPRKHDIILFFSKTDETKFNFDNIRIPYENNNNKPAKWKDGVHKKNSLGTKCLDWFSDIPSFMTASQSKERTGYPTQKPLSLLERIIKASSNEGDIVLDAFCGCCTTMIAAEKLGRKWIGIDISVKAYELVKERLKKELEKESPFFQEVHKQKDLGITYTHEVPKRADTEGDSGLEKKYVYIISHKKHKNYYKVGIAKDYKSRWNSYQTADPEREYELEFYYHTENFREIEKYIHSKFDNKFEWVSGDLQDIIKEIKEFDINEYNKMINKEIESLEK